MLPNRIGTSNIGGDMLGVIEEKRERYEKIRLILIFAAVTMLGLIFRWMGIRHESGDFNSCLAVWYDALEAGGGLKALSAYSGDYNMPYVTVLLLLTYTPLDPIVAIKSFSILFDVICALAGGALALTCGNETKNGAQVPDCL